MRTRQKAASQASRPWRRRRRRRGKEGLHPREVEVEIFCFAHFARRHRELTMVAAADVAAIGTSTVLLTLTTGSPSVL